MSSKAYKILPITRIQQLGSGYTVLWVEDAEMAGTTLPGQFFQLRAGETGLFKPISVYDARDDRLGFMVKAVGAGTRALCALESGQPLQLIGPLGTAFPPVQHGFALLVSGGVGYPPLAFLRKALPSTLETWFLHGGACAGDVFNCDETYTEDGSAGNRGYVTRGLERLASERRIDVVYSCGPLPMLKAIQDLCSEKGIKHYASLEAYMACGVGVCHGCAVPALGGSGYLRVCADGPVFDADDLDWGLM